MRYLSAKPMEKLHKPMTLDNGSTETPSLPKVIKLLFDAYGPTQAFSLTAAQIRSLNKALDAMDGDPEDGFYLLDDAEFAVVRVLLEEVGPRVLLLHARNVPDFLDALDAAPTKKPEPVKV